MGIFDLFGSASEREQAQLKKLTRKLTEKYGPPENRQKAIEQLAELGTSAALQARSIIAPSDRCRNERQRFRFGRTNLGVRIAHAPRIDSE